jgi:thioredoxin-related protein
MLQRAYAATIAAGLLLGCIAIAGHAAEDIGYDPQADPFVQLEHGAALAKAQDKLVLLIAGGDWCIWCHYLNAFVKNDAEVALALDDAFVVVKVYFGDDNRNERFFASWPAADGYPHFWVFSGDGNLLGSQPTVVLEDGAKGYDKDEFLAFVERWTDRG